MFSSKNFYMEILTEFHFSLLFFFFAYSRLLAVEGVWLLEKRVLSMWKGRVMMMMMMTVPLMYHRQGYLQARHHWLKLTVLVRLQLNHLFPSQLCLAQTKLGQDRGLQVRKHEG
jgi:hypothetical protein